MPHGIDFVYTEKAIGVCVFCFKSVFQSPTIAYGPDLICPDCVKEIVKLARANVIVPVYSCKHCGEEFDNKGSLMAHYRNDKCEKKEEGADSE